ncbi:MAG: prefoldin subunit [Candidatus Micrarchaeota archaeon]|nr:prefoldin subunit [Candidatus Micrarchaeota archaeon]
MEPQKNPTEQDVERMARDYQTVQEQLRVVSMQLEQLRAQKIDLERAKAEIDRASGKVYISVGGIIVETTKDKALADIKDKAELGDTRISSLAKQQTDLRTREKGIGEKLTQFYKQAQGRQQGAGTPDIE